MFPEKCQKDEDDDSFQMFGSTKYRETLYVYKEIPLLFDFENPVMSYFRSLAVKTYWYLVGFIVLQFIILFVRDVGFLPLWTMVEYMQLCAFIPLYNFRMIPYLYDTFKPMLVSHCVLTNDAYVLKEFEGDFFNENYEYYWLNIAKLG